MSSPIRRDFADELLWLPIAAIAPRRVVTRRQRQSIQYQRLLASLRMVGLVEPLVVFRRKDATGGYFLLDGHLRLTALRRLRQEPIRCIEALSEEGFTYNWHVDRLSPNQSRWLVQRALQYGIPEERLTLALDANPRAPLRKQLNFEGIAPEVVQHLRNHPIAPATVDILRKLTPARQIAVIELMAISGTYTTSYAKVLLLASKQQELVNSAKAKRASGLAATSFVRSRYDTPGPQRAWRQIEASYGEDVMRLIIAAPYFRKLLENERVRKHLAVHHRDTFDQIRSMLAYWSLSEPDKAGSDP